MTSTICRIYQTSRVAKLNFLKTLETLENQNTFVAVYKDEAKWLVGENICTADLTLTVFLFRLWILGLSKSLYENKLPRVHKYFQHALVNMPGFKEVCFNFESVQLSSSEIQAELEI